MTWIIALAVVAALLLAVVVLLLLTIVRLNTIEANQTARIAELEGELSEEKNRSVVIAKQPRQFDLTPAAVDLLGKSIARALTTPGRN